MVSVAPFVMGLPNCSVIQAMPTQNGGVLEDVKSSQNSESPEMRHMKLEVCGLCFLELIPTRELNWNSQPCTH